MSEHLAPDRTGGRLPAASRRDRVRNALRAAAPALLWYAAARLTGMLILAVTASLSGKDALHLLSSRWDSVWYQRVAANWYGYEVRMPDGSVHADLAFFPLLPALERGLSEVLHISLATAGLTVTWTASLVAAWGIYAVGARLRDHRTGVILAVLWGVYPTAFVQSMAYTETLFTAAAAWLLHCALTDRWIIAGTLATVAGLTRPSAAALIAALGITAVVTLVRDARAPAPLGRVLRRRWRMIAGTLLAPVGWLGYVVFVGIRRQDPFAYFTVQGDWGNHIDGGAALAGFIWKNLTGPAPLAGLGLCAAMALLAWTVWLCVRQRQPLPVLAYTIALVLLSLIGSGYFGSRPRLMMPAFPLLLPAAVALARWSPARTRWTLAALALASGTYGTITLLGAGPP